MKNYYKELITKWEEFKEALNEYEEECEKEYNEATQGKVLDDGSNPFDEASNNLDAIDEAKPRVDEIDESLSKLIGVR